MADHDAAPSASPTPEQRRITAELFERANQVITSGNHDYGIQLLLTCCKVDPANLIYRQALRRTERAKFKNNLRGSRLALLTNSTAKARIKAAKRKRNYLKVLEHGEEVLTRNPWDVHVQMDMAEAADAQGLLDLAVWILEQARQKDPQHVALNRSLARLYEKRGNFNQAISLWQLVHKVDPRDIEANHKAKDLAASETIMRGQYDQLGPGEGEDAAEQPSAPAPHQRSQVIRMANEENALHTKMEADPTKPAGYLNMAAYYRRHSQWDKAEHVLQQGLSATGNQFQLMLDLADLQIEPFRRDLFLAEEKLRAEPHNEDLRRIWMGFLKEVNTREIDFFRMKADRYPTELAPRLELGIRLLRAGQVDEAIKELQTSRADSRIAWRSLYFLGFCFKHRNNWRLARRNWEESLAAMPHQEQATRKELLFVLAQGCAEAGDLTTAVELGHDLANLDYAYRDINQLLDQWQTRLATTQ